MVYSIDKKSSLWFAGGKLTISVAMSQTDHRGAEGRDIIDFHWADNLGAPLVSHLHSPLNAAFSICPLISLDLASFG